MANTEIEYAYTTFKVVGDSMDDGTRSSFESGDIILTKPVEIDKFKSLINNDFGSFWVIKIGEEVLFKQVVQDNEIDGLHCRSLNESYSDLFMKIEDISGLYRVMQKRPKPVYYGD